MNERLKLLRVENGISQAEFAKRIGVSQAAVAQWEKGATSPSASQVSHIALVFGVNPGWITGTAEVKTQEYNDALTVAALALFRQLSETDKKVVNDVLEYYLKYGCSPYQSQ